MNTFNFKSNKFFLTINVDDSDSIFSLKNKEGVILSTYLKELLCVVEELFYDNGKHELNFSQFRSDSFEFSVNFCDEKEIKELNNEYREKDSVTDVLSFSLHGDLRNLSSLFVEESSPVLHLGDIFICKEVAISQSKKEKIPLPVELLELIIHGFLHLCGYDHELSKEEEKSMYKIERNIFDRILGSTENE